LSNDAATTSEKKPISPANQFILPRKEIIGFDWSLKPFRNFVRILMGIDLKSSKSAIEKCSLWSKLFTWGHILLFFLVNLTVNAMWFVELIKQIIPLDANESNTFLLEANETSHKLLVKDIFEYLNSNVYYLGLHLYFLYITCLSSKWNDLWDSLQTISKEYQFEDEQFRKCRRAVLFGLVWLATV
jgi:hypothetical protein